MTEFEALRRLKGHALVLASVPGESLVGLQLRCSFRYAARLLNTRTGISAWQPQKHTAKTRAVYSVTSSL